MLTTQVWNPIWKSSISTNPVPTMSSTRAVIQGWLAGKAAMSWLTIPASCSLAFQVSVPLPAPEMNPLIVWSAVKSQAPTDCVYTYSPSSMFLSGNLLLMLFIFLTKIQIKLFIKWIRFGSNYMDCESLLSWFVPVGAAMLWKGSLLGFIRKKLKTHLIALFLSKRQVEWTQKCLVKITPISNSRFEIGMLLPNDKKYSSLSHWQCLLQKNTEEQTYTRTYAETFHSERSWSFSYNLNQLALSVLVCSGKPD